MSASKLALAAKKVIDAAWLHGSSYDLSSQAAFALESARMLQQPVPLGPVAEPLALTEVQIDALAEAGNRVVNDAVHEDLCMCDGWPEKCSSSGNFHMGDWDMSGLETALPAVLTLWEQMRGGEMQRLRSRIAELESERHTTNEALDDAVQTLRERQAEREALVERMRAGQRWERGRNPELVSENVVSQSELREIFGIPLTAPWDDEPATTCCCHEPDADPYACEADDCTYEFPELSPFSGAAKEHDAKVSLPCGCGFTTSVWHVNDGSAEEELHRHVARTHGGIYPQKAGAR